VLGKGASAAGLALGLKTWTDRVIVCTNGRSRLDGRQRGQLAEHGIAVDQRTIRRLEHDGGWVSSIVFDDDTRLACERVFFSGPQSQRCELPRQLGCELTHKGAVKTDHLGQTRVPGLYVVGDASRDVQFAIVAAAEGAKAGVAINKALQARAGLAVDNPRAPDAPARKELSPVHG
jgi:thioredoxin reductase